MCQIPKKLSFFSWKWAHKQQTQNANEGLLVFKDNNHQWKKQQHTQPTAMNMIMFLYTTGIADHLIKSGFWKPN